MKLKTTLHITSFTLACTLVVAVVPSQADVSNTGYLMVAKDQTRDRDRLRDRSCLDAIDAARAAMDRNRIREAMEVRTEIVIEIATRITIKIRTRIETEIVNTSNLSNQAFRGIKGRWVR